MGTQYLKGSVAKLKFNADADEFIRSLNGAPVELTVDSCTECDTFPMKFVGSETHIQVDKDALVWTSTMQRDYG